MYCGAGGAYRCPEVTQKTEYRPPVKPAVDPSLLMGDAANELTRMAPVPVDSPKADVAFSNILFDFNQSKLTGIAVKSLKQISSDLKDKNIELRGFTDIVGTEHYNDVLASRRAFRVKAFLVQQGLDPSRITIKGDGKCCFVAPNDSDGNRHLNRRVEIHLKKN